MLNDTPTCTRTIDSCHDSNQNNPHRERRIALVLGPNRTPVLDESWIFFPLMLFPSHLPVLLLYYSVSPLSWVEKLTCKLSSLFSILWPLYKVCAVSVSALILLLTGWTQVGKEPPWPRQRVLAPGLDPKKGPLD